MKTLLDPTVTADTLNRLKRVQANSPRQWGKMSAHQMVCHLSDAFLLSFGEREASPASGFLQRTVIKAIALRAPISWPKGVPTRPEMDQHLGGTPPAEFDADMLQLTAMINRFARPDRDFRFGVHPIFGALSDWEWMRWGFLHVDHHLRQFGL